jgi:hypothetical protein
MLERTTTLILLTLIAAAPLAACTLDSAHCIGDCNLLTETSQTTEGTSTTTEGTSMTTEPGATTTDTGGPVCPCIRDDDKSEMFEPNQPLCGEELCPTLNVTNGYICEIAFMGDDIGLTNPEALACALTALRDRTPGLVRWNCMSDGGQFEDYGYVLIGDDGTAIRRNWGWLDASYRASDALQGALPDPGVFEACLAESDEALRFECLRRFMIGEPHLVCDEGWEHHSG